MHMSTVTETVAFVRPNKSATWPFSILFSKVMQEVISHFNAALLNLKSQFRKARPRFFSAADKGWMSYSPEWAALLVLLVLVVGPWRSIAIACGNRYMAGSEDQSAGLICPAKLHGLQGIAGQKRIEVSESTCCHMARVVVVCMCRFVYTCTYIHMYVYIQIYVCIGACSGPKRALFLWLVDFIYAVLSLAHVVSVSDPTTALQRQGPNLQPYPQASYKWGPLI